MSLNHLKFVAVQAVNFNDMPELGKIRKANSDDYSHTRSSGFTIEKGDDEFVFEGDDIDYLDDRPVNGDITGLSVFPGGTFAYEFFNFSISVLEATVDVFPHSSQGVLEELFEGDNAIVGSAFNDTLFGFDGDDNIKGEAGNDKIKGNGDDDKINGGPGNDILRGKGDNDRFVFNSALDASTNVDELPDFNHRKDSLVLDTAIFAGLTEVNGHIDPNQFVVGGSPTAPGPQIIYNPSDRAISYDADGNGPSGAVQFARLFPGTTLEAGDILLN